VTTLHVHDVHRLSLARVDLLAAFRSPDVANALGDAAELCGAELRPVWPSRPVVGVALTVQLAAGDNLGAIAASLHAQPGDVLVLAGGGDASRALVGGRVARVAMSRGVRACVVDGAVRDLDELERLGFPVFARAVTARRATKAGPSTIGCPVQCGSARVHAGDAVLADRDGVAVVPAAVLDAALARIAAAAAAEREEDADFDLLERRFRAIVAAAAAVRLPVALASPPSGE
jgi:regulator of RNase E activity RraA